MKQLPLDVSPIKQTPKMEDGLQPECRHTHPNALLKGVVHSIKMSICLCDIKKPAEKELPKSKVDVYVRVCVGECPLKHACAAYLLVMRS